jgi:hypothetical protein
MRFLVPAIILLSLMPGPTRSQTTNGASDLKVYSGKVIEYSPKNDLILLSPNGDLTRLRFNQNTNLPAVDKWDFKTGPGAAGYLKRFGIDSSTTPHLTNFIENSKIYFGPSERASGDVMSTNFGFDMGKIRKSQDFYNGWLNFSLRHLGPNALEAGSDSQLWTGLNIYGELGDPPDIIPTSSTNVGTNGIQLRHFEHPLQLP